MRVRLRYVLFAAVAAYLATGLYQVPAGERGVVRRFGAVVARPGPGLGVGLPWGFDAVDRVSVRARQLAVGYEPELADDTAAVPPGQFLTGDQNLVNAKLVVEYVPDDVDDYLAQRDRVDGVLSREVEAAAAEWFAGRPVDDALLAGRAALPAWLAGRLPGRLAPLRLGVAVHRVSVDYLAPPPEVRAAFEEVNRAQTAIGTKRFQAEQEAEARLKDAAAVRFRLEQQADAYRHDKVTLARADADAFTKRLEQYRRLRAANPDVLAGIWWDETGKLLMGLKARGRVDVLDAHLAADGLDVTQFLPKKK